RRAVLLRSGTQRRRSEPLRRFLRSWERGGRWAFVAAPPDAPPATARPAAWVRALTDASHVLPSSSTAAALDAAKRAWPQEPIVLFAAAEHEGAAGRWDAAARGYSALLEIEPDNAAARNNLANMLADGGCFADALREARAALEAVGPASPLRAAIEDTVAAIDGASAGTATPAHCSTIF